MLKLMNAMRMSKEGATAIEYGLIAALIAVASIAAMMGMGSQLKSTFSKTSSVLSTSNS